MVRTEALGKYLWEVTHGAAWEKMCDKIRKIGKDQQISAHASEAGYNHLKNRQFLAEIDAHPLKDVSGSPLGTLLVVEDVTERVNMEKRLNQSEKLSAIGKLASGLAHEIGSPLGAISGYAERLISKLNENDRRRSDAENIKAQLDRITRLVRQLLIFARQSSPQLKQVKVNGIIRSTIEILVPELKNASIEVALELQENLPVIEADPDQLYQVFFNIILNAKQAMSDHGGKLTVTSSVLRKPQDIQENGTDLAEFIEICIVDTGMGIHPDHQKRIFEPFFTTKDVGEGSGLGLAICHGIISDHGGWIEVESKEGEGSSFKVILPVKKSSRSLNLSY